MYRKNLTVLVLVLGLIGMTILAAPVFAADADLIISEVMHDSVTGSQWVEIHNKGAAAIDLNGWQICDKGACDVIASVSTIVNPGAYFIIGETSGSLPGEFASYTPADSVIPAQTVYIADGAIGNTLGNNDILFLVSPSTLVSDCVSWDSFTFTSCSPTPGGTSPLAGTAYDTGADGTDGAPNGSATSAGQSIVRVNTNPWGVSPANDPSPYGLNIIDGGPTAVNLNTITANNNPTIAAVTLAGLFLMAASAIAVMRRKATA